MQFKCNYSLSKTLPPQAPQPNHTAPTQTIQSSTSMQLVLFNVQIGLHQVPPLRDRVDPGAMAMKGFSAPTKALASLEPHHQTAQHHIQDTH